MRYLFSSIALFLVLLVCPGVGWGGTHALQKTSALVPGYDITTWPPAPFRWKDIAENVYAESYRNSYTYDSAVVTVTLDLCNDSVLSGHLEAQNLKPNFAYQAKLVGKPVALWGVEGDDVANENIGYTGRWWRHSPTPGNSNDSEYQTYHDDPDYIFEGYLLFDFFLTDSTGAAALDFSTNSSYHVLWWVHQRTAGACDSPPKTTQVIGYAGQPAYDENVGPTEVGVYAQIERLCTGTTTMPEGAYSCRFLLTEESFHQSGEINGYWASAMVCDTIQFQVGNPTFVGRGDERATVLVLPARPNPARSDVMVEFSLPRPGPVSLSIYEPSGRRIRSMADGRLPAGNHRISWDGRDAVGRPVAPGVYLYRFQAADDRAHTGKVTIVR